jgi:SAM-dependent methyltransferase
MKVSIRYVSDRIQELRKGISKQDIGLEIGPFFRPICPKKEGFQVVTLDVFSREELIEKYAKDPNVYPYFDDIEKVDIVSSKCLLEAVSSSGIYKLQPSVSKIFDYIITSHHFEHIANPVQFLRDAEKLLKEQGSLTMAIPIHTRCFDLYKPLSSTGKLIDAYINKQTSPSLGTVFNHLTLGAHKKDGLPIGSPNQCNKDLKLIWDELETFQTDPNFSKEAWFKQLASNHSNGYIDAHCNFFNPISFCLIIADLKMLGLLNELQVHDISEHREEFIVHLKKGKPLDKIQCSELTRTEIVQAAIQYSVSELLNVENSVTPRPEIEASLYLDAILNSRSWKITKPYRALGRLLHKLLIKMGKSKKTLGSNFIT